MELLAALLDRLLSMVFSNPVSCFFAIVFIGVGVALAAYLGEHDP